MITAIIKIYHLQLMIKTAKFRGWPHPTDGSHYLLLEPDDPYVIKRCPRASWLGNSARDPGSGMFATRKQSSARDPGFGMFRKRKQSLLLGTVRLVNNAHSYLQRC